MPSDFIINELKAIRQNDQMYREFLKDYAKNRIIDSVKTENLFSELKHVDSVNRVKVFSILNEFGWPSRDIIGEENSKTIWLVIQHSSLEIQEKYLAVVKKAVNDKNLPAKYLAYLEDRIATDNGAQQLYGTQFITFFKDGRRILLPIKNVDSVDSRRIAVGLPTLKLFFKENFGEDWNIQMYYKDLPEALTYLNESKERKK